MNMGKDNVFLNDVEVPEVVWEKLDAAFLIIKEERDNTMKKEKRIQKKYAVTVAAAACMTAIVAAVAVNGGWMRPASDVAEIPSLVSDAAEIPSDIDMVSTNEDTFTLAIMGAELEKDKPVQLVSDSSLITEKYAGDWMIESREGGGVDYCINVPFTCQGNNIKNVTYSINNGAFQIIQPVGESIIVDGQIYDGELNTGMIGGFDDESIDGVPVPAYETLFYRSFTLDYQKQSDEKTWINICNECPDNGELESMIFGYTTLENNNLGIQKMLNHTVITCTVNYTDGTSKSADVLVNSCIMTCAEAGAEIKEDPDREEIFITFELQ